MLKNDFQSYKKKAKKPEFSSPALNLFLKGKHTNSGSQKKESRIRISTSMSHTESTVSSNKNISVCLSLILSLEGRHDS